MNEDLFLRDKEFWCRTILDHVRQSLVMPVEQASPRDLFRAVSLAVRDRLAARLLETEGRYRRIGAKRLYYLSIEFLMGRSLSNNLANLCLQDSIREALQDLRRELGEVEGCEGDAGLGNGGLGRLAACFLDSLATLDYPGFGYGINYEYGLFKQEIRNGEQVEMADNWRTYTTPWLIERPQDAVLVPLYGRIEHAADRSGGYNPMWLDWKVVIGVPHDMPIVGYGGKTVNYLRLYSARASRELDMAIFNEGDYLQAVTQKVTSETISKVLYPSDSVAPGRELRLIQEYFLVACAMRDIVGQYKSRHSGFDRFPDQVAVQLNDTHPALAVVELMRILVDEECLEWDAAWQITESTFAYTNHTLLPEALERWSVPLMERVLPRHLQIIYEINRRLLEQVRSAFPGDEAALRRLSLIQESDPKQVRMENLAIAGSHSVNGVAEVHSELVKKELVPEFHRLWPERFNNKTNGVTQRRWLLLANPGLARLITQAIGDRWVTDLEELRKLETLEGDGSFPQEFREVKRRNKQRLAGVIREVLGLSVDPDSLFDVHIKRIHEYKRQLLNLLHIVHEYLSLVEGGLPPNPPRTYLFAGKAAPGYFAAKQIIRAIHDVAAVVNNDPRSREYLKVAFLPDYRVSLAELMVPAADLSEQISTAGTEASGTGNMKLAMNGALTMATLDGANIEIREAVGPENMLVFGLTVGEIRDLQARGAYRPWELYQSRPAVRAIMDAFQGNRFCPDEPGGHEWIVRKLLAPGESYFHLADLESYLAAHRSADRLWADADTWTRKAIRNVSRSGRFSSDRSIGEYAREIWNLKPVSREKE